MVVGVRQYTFVHTHCCASEVNAWALEDGEGWLFVTTVLGGHINNCDNGCINNLQ